MATLNENITRIENAKASIKTAIEAKGVIVPAETKIEGYAAKIDEIQTGGGSATALDYGEIGYTQDDTAFIKLQSDLAYSKTKYDEWNPATTTMETLYKGDVGLVYAPKIDSSNVTHMGACFQDCINLISVPQLNTSSVTNMTLCFSGCKNLTSVPAFDTSKVTSLGSCFNGCKNLYDIPVWNTSSVTDMNGVFLSCQSLRTIPAFDTSKVENMKDCFRGCKNLTSIPEWNCSSVISADKMFKFGLDFENLTDLGGFPGLKLSLDLSGANYYKMEKLTKESVMNVINKVAQADPAVEASPKLTFCSTVYALLTPEDIKIATDKGWTIVDAGY